MKNKILIITLSVLSVIFINSCTKDFDEINKDPNYPGLEKASPDMLLTNAVESLTDRVHEIFIGHEMGSGWVQHMAKVQYTDEDRYNYRISVVNNTWNSLYGNSGMDVETILRYAKANNLKNYEGVALVLKSYISSLLTDMFGDVPYSQAWKAVDDVSATLPAYDTQESIYMDVIAKLDTANSLLSVTNEKVKGDILYAGDITKWKKFANSLRLRLLLRMSDKNISFVTTEMSKMTDAANAETYPIFESNADNASLVYLGSLPNNNPINENRKTRDDHRVSKTLVDFMYTNNPKVDWRITAYAQLAESPGDYVGLPNGLLSADALAYKGNGLKETSTLGVDFTSATAPGVLMSFAELKFILAEAAVKGYIGGGIAVAQTHYEAGILASYQQHEATIVARTKALFGPATATLASLYTDYMTNGGAAWDPTIAMNQIAYEKWIALFDQGLQAFIEWRRLDYPVLTAPVASENSGKVPSRYPYPSDENARNGSSLDAAVQAQNFSSSADLNGKVWWDIH